jgi:hypothetical protein
MRYISELLKSLSCTYRKGYEEEGEIHGWWDKKGNFLGSNASFAMQEMLNERENLVSALEYRIQEQNKEIEFHIVHGKVLTFLVNHTRCYLQIWKCFDSYQRAYLSGNNIDACQIFLAWASRPEAEQEALGWLPVAERWNRQSHDEGQSHRMCDEIVEKART